MIDRRITTRGLPGPDGPIHPERVFEFHLSAHDGEPARITIPKKQCGQLEWIADDSAQAAWLDRHAARWVRPVWDCWWELRSDEALVELERALEPFRVSSRDDAADGVSGGG